MTVGKAVRPTSTRDLDVTVASQRRRQILEAARACITEEGVEKLTLRKVGERAQVSHATITYYFKTRKDLIDSALLEISDDFLDVLRQRETLYGMGDLRDLLEHFLDAENPSARFVVQMIDAGQHDADLRATHDEFIQYGRDRIERSMRVAMEMGELRRDVDPAVAAALFHSMLVWWQSELAAGAGSRDIALAVGRLVLSLLERPGADAGRPLDSPMAAHDEGAASLLAEVSPVALIEASLMRDPHLDLEARTTLAETFASLYRLAAGRSLPEAGPT
jgi:AcrR family transcriptional regulator